MSFYKSYSKKRGQLSRMTREVMYISLNLAHIVHVNSGQYKERVFDIIDSKLDFDLWIDIIVPVIDKTSNNVW